jgi:tight adherence protein C
MENSYIAYAIIAVGVFTAYMAVVQLFKRNRLHERLQTVGGYEGHDDDDAVPPVLASFAGGVLATFGVRVKERKDVALLLAQAGIASPYAPTYYLFFKNIVQPILFVLGAFLLGKLLLSTEELPMMAKAFRFMSALMLIVAGAAGAKLYVTNRKQRHQQILNRSFPEALDLLLVCIESGLGLDAALARVCAELRKSHPEITAELDRTRAELTIMNDRSQALQNLADRTDIVPFRSLVAALMQTEKFGTSLVDTLRVLSEDMRIMRLLSAENRAARIPVLITIPLIFCILPAFVMVILGPAYVKVDQQGGLFGERNPNKNTPPPRKN